MNSRPSLNGSGTSYAITVTPQVKGLVKIQYSANQVVGATSQGNYASNPLSVSFDPLNQFLATWLPLDEDSGSMAADASGNGNFGTLNNMASTAWTSGNTGNGLRFDGVDDYVSISNGLPANFTISCWIKTIQSFPQVTATYDGTGIIWSDVGGAANDFVFGGTRSAGGVNRPSFFVGSGNATISGNQEISTGEWVNLAVTRNANSGEVKLYVNGLLDAVGTAGLAALNSNPNIHIGGNTLDGRYFNGSIDEVRLYSRALTQMEIATLLTTTAPTVLLTTPVVTVTNSFLVTATFSEVISGFAADDVIVVNGYVGPISGSGGVYGFTVTPTAPGPVTVRIPANRVIDEHNNGNVVSDDLLVSAIDDLIPSLGLVGYWSFNETNGTIAFDLSSASNNGTLVNLNTGHRVPGVWGNGIFFNGTNGYVTVSNNLGGDFSLSLWVKTTQAFQENDQTYNGTGIIWSDVGGAANDFILGGTRNANGTNRFSFFTGNPDSSLNGTHNISDGKWTHLAVVRTKATGARRIYVNGALEASDNGGTNLLTANPVLHIGGNTLGGRYFLGLIDEVRAYNRTLSDAEVAQLAQAGGYQSWALGNLAGADAALVLPSADPDADGQNNLLEYAFDSNPLAANGSPFTIVRAGDGSIWLSYPRRTGFSGLRYTVWKSNDLVTWTPVSDGILDEMSEAVLGQPLEMVSGRIVNVSGSAFFRLEVNLIGQ